ncbi:MULTISPECIES: acylphosphatase [Kitasatospora]|uniref:acylphosphatase n=1 Tax=Kitasatospora cathayae TaxID=3004092 RepID=A0ABY7PXG6_9ACTN|nr:acylphosphatase [Kitasatospora sp. HUAS 3-15]WBP84879.1 acylphosphatase [Kitasatospora sp. HUAS 3-15]
MIRSRVIVSGEVQGVFYRDTCRREATAQGVRGWVRNLSDGTVEAVFEGTSAAVRRMVEWTGQGPPLAIVDRVLVWEEQPEGLTGFEIRATPWPG